MLERAEQHPACGQTRAPADDGVRLAHAAQVFEQAHGVLVGDQHPVDIGDRQAEAGTLQQPGGVAQVHDRRNARAVAAADPGFGLDEGSAQFVQGFTTQRAAQKHPVGAQRRADLRQHPRQVVDPVQGHVGEDQIEGRRAQRKKLGIGLGGAVVEAQVDQLQLAAVEGLLQPGRQELTHAPRPPAQHGDGLEALFKVEQPVGQPLCDFAVQEMVARVAVARSPGLKALGVSVEHLWRERIDHNIALVEFGAGLTDRAGYGYRPTLSQLWG